MKRRIFIASMISESFINSVALKDIENKNSSIRVVENKNLHITLLPPWYTKNINEDIEKFKKINLKTRPLRVHFTSIEPGSSVKQPNLIWAKAKYSKGMNELKKELEKIFNRKTEKRELIPHVTLARFPKNISMKEREFKSRTINREEKINKISLVESVLKRSGASYTVLAERKL